MYSQRTHWMMLFAIAPFLMGFCIFSQGFKGHVLFKQNEMMPLKGKSNDIGSPYTTVVYVYEAADVNQLIDQQGNWAKGINAKLIKEVISNKAGEFKLNLKPGKYTVLLGYQEGLYIPFFSGNTGVAFLEVKKCQFQEIDLTITASSIF